MRPVQHKYGSEGFTLIEVMIAVILVGIAIASLVASSVAFTQSTGAATDISTAEFLIEEIRELTAGLDYDDLYDFDGLSFSPPINAKQESLDNLSGFTQHVIVENVSATDFEVVVDDHSSVFVRVAVGVTLNGKEIGSAQWLRARY